MIDTAMVLAAGLGTRLRPLTLSVPKPLLPLAGKPMLDHALDHAVMANVKRAVINVHYLPGKIMGHVSRRKLPMIMIADETGRLLETGGGIKNALGYLNRDAFFTLNSDVMWRDTAGAAPALMRMQQFWNPDIMDSLLLVTPRETAVGFEGAGDYFIDANGKLSWRGDNENAPYVYAGATITKGKDFANYPEKIFSQKRVWDMQEKRGRLYGIVHTGDWYHCSTPQDYEAVTRQIG